VPERLFQAEKTILPLKIHFTVSAVQVGTPVLLHKIIGFPVPGEMDGMPLLLQVMAKVETPGRMPESFTADNKEDLHGVPFLIWTGMMKFYPESLSL
jgi:hypothetical protein